jgi:DNA modification methylase
LVVACALHAFVPSFAVRQRWKTKMKNRSRPRTPKGLRNDISALEQKLGPIVYRPLAALRRYENNPRKHPEKQLVKLTASIREFGFAVPVLIDENDTIIAGEARVEAANRAGMAEVPVVVAHHWSAAQVRAYRLTDNRLAELGTWDDDALAIELAAIIEFEESPIEILGWKTAEIDLILHSDVSEPNAESSDPADEQIAPSANPVSRQGDLWILGDHRLLCGSALDASNWERLLGDEVAAMVFADLLQAVLAAGRSCVDRNFNLAEGAIAAEEVNKGKFTASLSDVVAAMLPYCQDGAVLELCSDWIHLGKVLAAIEGNGLSLLDLCVWNKQNGRAEGLYQSSHEMVLIAKKGKAPHTDNVEKSNRTNVWDYVGIESLGGDGSKDLVDHPTVKPTALVADAILDVTHPGEIVLDACTGSGTTLLACERTKRRGYGIEIEPGYVDVAIRRWEAMTGEKAVLAETDQCFSAVALDRSTISHENDQRPDPSGAKFAV